METFHAEHLQVFSVFMDTIIVFHIIIFFFTCFFYNDCCSVFISYTWVRHLNQVRKYQMTTSVIMYTLGRGRQTWLTLLFIFLILFKEDPQAFRWMRKGRNLVSLPSLYVWLSRSPVTTLDNSSSTVSVPYRARHFRTCQCFHWSIQKGKCFHWSIQKGFARRLRNPPADQSSWMIDTLYGYQHTLLIQFEWQCPFDVHLTAVEVFPSCLLHLLKPSWNRCEAFVTCLTEKGTIYVETQKCFVLQVVVLMLYTWTLHRVEVYIVLLWLLMVLCVPALMCCIVLAYFPLQRGLCPWSNDFAFTVLVDKQ